MKKYIAYTNAESLLKDIYGDLTFDHLVDGATEDGNKGTSEYWREQIKEFLTHVSHEAMTHDE